MAGTTVAGVGNLNLDAKSRRLCPRCVPDRQRTYPLFVQKLDFNGAPRRNRTADPIITNDVLYQLSYRGTARVLGERPPPRKRRSGTLYAPRIRRLLPIRGSTGAAIVALPTPDAAFYRRTWAFAAPSLLIRFGTPLLLPVQS